eukprot:tig00021126_g18462.t1
MTACEATRIADEVDEQQSLEAEEVSSSSRTECSVASEAGDSSDLVSSPSSGDISANLKAEASSGHHSDEEEEGYDEDGNRFPVPHTKSMFALILNPRNWTLPEICTVSLMAIQAYLVFFCKLPLWFHIANFFFWRIAYNIGLGWLLDQQSKNRLITKKVDELLAEDNRPQDEKLKSMFARITLYLVMGRSYWRQRNPSSVTAWLAFRHLVSIILTNDGWTYTLLLYRCLELPKSFGFSEFCCYALGLGLCAFNYWAKMDAHRVIGDYAWYWGDFFFRVDRHLVFDGIFQMFPHPMYTVGYSVYYGFSLIARSYTLLFVSVGAHMLQLIFLTVVEEPHIQKTYGGPEPVDGEHVELFKAGFIKPKREPLMFKNLDLFRASDVSLVVIVVQALLLSLLDFHPYFYVAQAFLWRLAHCVGMSVILSKEGKSHWWSRHFVARGYTKQEAFDNWKRLYNISVTVNHVVFAIAAWKMASAPEVWTARALARQLAGAVLIALNLWASRASYEVLGDFGWFYGDFFVEDAEYQASLRYTGIYRYFNHPDLLMGFVALYGLALIARSPAVFALAAFAQLAQFAFIKAVELPHMRRRYSEVRANGGLSRELKAKLSKALDRPPVKELRVKVQRSVQSEFESVAGEIEQLRTRLRTKVRAVKQRGERTAERVAELRAALSRADTVFKRVRSESPLPKEAEELLSDASRIIRAQIDRVERASRRLVSHVHTSVEKRIFEERALAASSAPSSPAKAVKAE